MLAEDLLLLLTDDASGKFLLDASRRDLALASAVLVELTAEGRTRFTTDTEPDPGMVILQNATPVGDPLLDRALQQIPGQRPTAPEDVLYTIVTGLRTQLLERLVTQGKLRAERKKVLGLIPRESWPAGDTTHKNTIRHRLHNVLVNGHDPAPNDAALIGLLNAFEQTHKVISGTGISNRELNRRADAIAEGDIAGPAVRDALNQIIVISMRDPAGSPPLNT